MNKFLIILVILAGSYSYAKETVNLPFSNGDMELTASIQYSESDEAIYVEDVSIEIPSVSHGTLLLVAEFGWGDKPYNYLCEIISQSLLGTQTYKYASAYGYVAEPSLLGGFFASRSYLIINRDQSFTISESYPNSTYDSGFACYAQEMVY
jgi:hypothetical protein